MYLKLMLLVMFLGFASSLIGQKMGENFAMNNKIPTVHFCEMVKHPEKYFDQSIRITATFTQATEGQYLSDEKKCPLSHDDQIGVGYDKSESLKSEDFNQSFKKIQSVEFGSRAVVMLVGVLRNVSRRDFSWYRFRFDISKFEEISQVIEDYGRDLVAQITYRAEVQKDKNFGIGLVKLYPLPHHYAQRFEWTNLKDFPVLKEFEKRIVVFTVLSNEIKQIFENRWNVTIRCKIVRVE
jgi:hypothetical protein